VLRRDLFGDADADNVPTAGSTAPLLYVRRPPDVTRHVDNDDEVRQALARLGFQTIEPERLPFREQVERFRAARCIVLPHGAALANLVHRIGRPTGVVELFPGEWEFVRRVIGPWLSRDAGFGYRAVAGTPLSEHGGFSVPRDAVISAVTAVLRELGDDVPGATAGSGSSAPDRGSTPP